MDSHCPTRNCKSAWMKNAIGKWIQLELTREEQLELAFKLETDAKIIREELWDAFEPAEFELRVVLRGGNPRLN